MIIQLIIIAALLGFPALALLTALAGILILRQQRQREERDY